MAEPAVKVPELDSWRRNLARANNPAAYRRAFQKEERLIAVKVATLARSNAVAHGGSAKHFANTITGSATRDGARVGLRGGKANAAFWGAKKHTGWYAKGRYSHSPKQHPEWVGSSWIAGGPGGPIAINPAVAELSPLIPGWYGEAIEKVNAMTFPNHGGEGF